MHIAMSRAHVEGCLGADSADKIDSLRVDIGLVLISIVLFSDGDAGQRGTLLSEVRDNFTCIDAGDSRNTFPRTPLSKALYGGPMAMLQSVVLDDNARGLNVGGLEVSEQAVLVPSGGRYAVVTNQWLSKDEDLAAVRRVSHRLGVSNEGGGEDGLARNVGLGSERFAGKDGAILNGGE